jgi:hypothetical protein
VGKSGKPLRVCDKLNKVSTVLHRWYHNVTNYGQMVNRSEIRKI